MRASPASSNPAAAARQGATTGPTQVAEAAVDAALITTLQGNLLGIACGNALIATLMALGLAGAVSTPRLLGWLAFQWLHSALSAWSWWQVRQRPASVRSAPRRIRAARGSSAISGLSWALALPLLWPPDRLDLQLLMICMLIGMTAGAMHSLTADLPAFNRFLAPNVLAVSGMALWQGGTVQGVIAAASLVYGLTSARFAARLHASQRRALHQRDELTALAASLRAAAADLQAQKGVAEAASLAKSRFLAAASHDLRQPVHALSLFLGALGARPLDDESRRLVRHAGRTVAAMSKLFNALLDVSRLDAGMVQPDWRHVPLAPMLARIAEEEGAVARDKGLRFVLRLPHNAEVLTTRSDPLLLERVLRNLVANAVRYTPHGGVLLALRRTGRWRGRAPVQPGERGLLLQVWDTGIGIPPDRQADVFQEFVQLHNPERDRTQGLGLGLAIVRRLVDLLGHPLALRSVPGRGTVFSLRLTLGEAAVPEPPTLTGLPVAATPASGRLVLVIDDDAEIRTAMQALLAGWGCEVIAADGLATLMPLLASLPRRPDLIISDYRLRGEETGLVVIEQLHAEYNDEIPAILVTGDTAAEPLRALEMSGVALLHKPVSAAALRAAMDQVLGGGAEG